MNRHTFFIVLIFCFTILSCKKKQAPVDPTVPVNLLTTKRQPVLYYDKYPSTTAALSQVNLLPQVPGAITGIFFKEGSHVHKGQKLYEIDRRLYQENYEAAIANLKVQQGTLVQAKQDEDRYAYLNKYNAVAKQLYDHAIITYQNAVNTVKSSEQAVKTARTNLGYAVVYAPFDGTIGFSQVKLGNVVTAGSTVLNTISTDNPMAVDFVINEKQISHFEELKNGKITHDSLFTILLPNNALYPHVGKISVIDRAVDAQTGAVRIRLVFNNPQDYLIAGMSCIVRVRNQENGPQILIPNKAVTEQMGEYFVFTAKDSLVNDTVKNEHGSGNSFQKKKKLLAIQKKVQVGQTIGPDIIIKKGLVEGDKIVTDGVQSLHDGVAITTADKIPPSESKGKSKGSSS